MMANILTVERRGIQMSVVVNQEKCAGCGVCIEVCPVQAISLNLRRKAQINREKCLECGRCARECPNQAIELTPETAYPLVSKDSTTAIATAVRGNKPQPVGTPMSVFRKPPALWKIIRPAADTIRSPQSYSNNTWAQKGSKGRGRGRRHRGGRR
jgi:Fe-S-cluster-containing hydrogenase component 2